MSYALTDEQLSAQERLLSDQFVIPQDIIRFAKETPGANIPALQAAVVANAGGMDVLDFFNEVPGADARATEDALISIGNFFAIRAYARRLPPGPSFDRMESAVLTSRSYKEVFLFAIEVPGVDLQKFKDHLSGMGAPSDVMAALDRRVASAASNDDALIPSAGQSAGIQPK